MPRRIGVYFALLQLVFTLSWTVYAVYLPQLAAAAGLGASAVMALLLIDQAVFMVADFATGVAADRVSRLIGRLGYLVGAVTLASCLAFLAMPFVAPAGAAALVVVILLWAVTTSALRAPPLMLLGKYAAKPAIPWLSSLAMLGYGLAGAVSPYLAVTLRDMDPRLPFIVSSVAVALAALGLTYIERTLAKDAGRKPAAATTRVRISLPAAAFAVALIVLALGYQLHFAINSAPMFLRFASRDALEWLMPVFWSGFNIAMFPAGRLVRGVGAYPVMGLAALFGGTAILATTFAGSLEVAVVAQLVAGAAWGVMLVSAFTLAFAIGDDGREGAMTGLLFSSLALATLTRTAVVAAGLPADPAIKALLQWTPIVCWLVAGAALLAACIGGMSSRLGPARS